MIARFLLPILAAACARSSDPPEVAPSPAPAPAHSKPAPPPASPNPRAKATMQSNGIAATWSLARRGGKLQVSYTVENQTGDRIYVCDRLVRGAPNSTYEAFEALTVGNYKKTDALLLMLGTPSKRGAVKLLPNTYVAVEPGQKHSGTRDVPIPFVAFNAYGRANPLSGQPTEAYLMIFTFRGEPPKWKEIPGAGGKAIRVPEGQQLEPLTLGPEPIPN